MVGGNRFFVLALFLLVITLFSVKAQPILKHQYPIPDYNEMPEMYREVVNEFTSDKIYYELKPNDIYINETGNYSEIVLDNFFYTHNFGMPTLPIKYFEIPIPSDAKSFEIEIIDSIHSMIKVNKKIKPFELKEHSFFGRLPRYEIYNEYFSTPDKLTVDFGYRGKQKYALIRYYPFGYDSNDNKLNITISSDLEIRYSDEGYVDEKTLHGIGEIWATQETLSDAQAPDVEWEKTFGGTGYEEGRSVQQTSDNGYILVGYTESFGAGSYDVYLIKTDSNGNKQWEKTFGGSSYDYGESVKQTVDGQYIITGSKGGDVYLIRTYADGNKQWEKTFGGQYGDNGYSVQQTLDGGYVIGGDTDSFGAGSNDVWLIKTNSYGSMEWDKTFGGSSYDHSYSVQQTLDEGYIIAGQTGILGAGHSDAYLIKTDSAGNKQWEKTFGGSSYDPIYSVKQTFDEGYILAGYTYSFGASGSDVYLIKTDSAGNKQWEKTFGGSKMDWSYSVEQTSDGGYIIAGDTSSFGAGSYDVYLIKTDSNGNKQWEKTFGGTYFEYIYSLQKTSDGGYILAGYAEPFGADNYEVYLIKLKGDTCSNGIKDGDETDIDCGGVCPPCPTCDDEIKNGYEEGIDCGWACGNLCNDSCISLIYNGDDKIDVVLIGSGFNSTTQTRDIFNDFIDYNDIGFYGLMSVEPFKSKKDKFNFWMINETRTFPKESYKEDSVNIAKNKCLFEVDQIVLLSVRPRFRSQAFVDTKRGKGGSVAFVTIGCESLGECSWPLDYARPGDTESECQGYGTSQCGNLGWQLNDRTRAFVHEFGHSFGGLDDEYNVSGETNSSSEDTVNCDHDSQCPKWVGIINGTSCIKGCDHTNWYRAYDNTIMRSHYNEQDDFGQVNINELMADINSYAESQQMKILTAVSAEEYNLRYSLLVNYSFGNLSLIKLNLISGTGNDGGSGPYRFEIISFEDNLIDTFNYSFNLIIKHEPLWNWFDENGTQIVMPNVSDTEYLNQTIETILAKYYPDAQTINIYNNSELKLIINVSKYHDLDGDKIIAVVDNCPFDYNPSQEDLDNDGIGDVCGFITLNISLTKGWNLISTPLDLSEKDVDSLFNKTNISIYNYKNNSWFVPDEIDNKLGYWLKINESKNLTLIGTEIENITIDLNKGWNLISYPSLNTTPINESLRNVNNTYDLILTYKDNKWLSYSPTKPPYLNTLKNLTPSYGYWVKVPENST